jgi:hypothetical protein
MVRAMTVPRAYIEQRRRTGICGSRTHATYQAADPGHHVTRPNGRTQGSDERPEWAGLQRVVEDSAQGEEDVATPAGAAVGRGSLHDLETRPRRPHPVTGYGYEACSRSTRATRRERDSTLLWPRPVVDEPSHSARRVRASIRRPPFGAPGPTGHGVLPGTAHASPRGGPPERPGHPADRHRWTRRTGANANQKLARFERKLVHPWCRSR